MVLVPAGEFLFGAEKRRVSLPAFYIDKTEVTNGAYQAFSTATGYALPAGFPSNRPGLPVVNVSVADAQAFATWAGKRLPKEMEWEKAARGVDGRRFPWGEKEDAAMANVAGPGLRPADGFPQGASPFGALQMVGNVWELVDQTAVPSERTLALYTSMRPPATRSEAWYMIRGESYGEPLAPNAIWDSTAVPARWQNRFIGFRCVRDVR
jgi:serine/threonine-protein kinase